MKYNLFILLTIFSFSLIAQNNYSYSYDWEMQMLEYTPIRYTPEKKVEEITFTTTNPKNGKSKTYTKRYNENGNITEYIEYNKNNELVKSVKLKYDENNYLSEITHSKKGKLKKTTIYVRNENGDPLSQKKLNSKNSILYYNTWKFNADGCLSENIRYKRGDEKVWYGWRYEYGEECDLSKTEKFNGKGKIKSTWTYDCKQEGEKLEKKKDITQVCKWEEVSKDVLIKVYQTFDEKGKTVKNVSKYTLTDTLILESARYNDKDELTYKSTYDRDFKKPLKQIAFKKGKVKYEREYRYENGRITFQSYVRKGKQKRKSEYRYNEENLLAELKSFNKKNELNETVKLNYGP